MSYTISKIVNSKKDQAKLGGYPQKLDFILLLLGADTLALVFFFA